MWHLTNDEIDEPKINQGSWVIMKTGAANAEESEIYYRMEPTNGIIVPKMEVVYEDQTSKDTWWRQI